MNVILFDDPAIRIDLLPFTFTRPVALIRTGILTIAEKWEKYLGSDVSFSTQDYLQEKFPVVITRDNLWINGAVCPTPELVASIQALKLSEGLYQNNKVIALRNAEDEIPEVLGAGMKRYEESFALIDQVWKIFMSNGDQIRSDFKLLTKGKTSASIHDIHTKVYGPENVFLEDGVDIKAAIINAEKGPVYLSKNSVVQEGAIINGPFALGEGSTVGMGAKIRGDVSVGPFCKVAGEVSTTVIFGYSNKGHDGFLGSAVLGEWCNLGADTNNSNLKNNYAAVKVWSYRTKKYVDSGLQFCGVMMGDHSKTGINTMLNTGTVVGVSANVFGGGFPPSFVPSFSWGGAESMSTYRLDKAIETASRVMARRNVTLSPVDIRILENVFNQEKEFQPAETNTRS